jgi:hypothetical protein
MKEWIYGLREGAIPEFLSKHRKFPKNLNQNNNSRPSWFGMLSSTWKQYHTKLIISGNRIFARRKRQEL